MTVDDFRNLIEDADGDAKIAFRTPAGLILYGVTSIVQSKRIDIHGDDGEVIVNLTESEAPQHEA